MINNNMVGADKYLTTVGYMKAPGTTETIRVMEDSSILIKESIQVTL